MIATIRAFGPNEKSECDEYQCVRPAQYTYQIMSSCPPPASRYCDLHLDRNLKEALR